MKSFEDSLGEFLSWDALSIAAAKRTTVLHMAFVRVQIHIVDSPPITR